MKTFSVLMSGLMLFLLSIPIMLVLTVGVMMEAVLNILSGNLKGG